MIGSDYALMQSQRPHRHGHLFGHRRQSCHLGQSAVVFPEPQRAEHGARTRPARPRWSTVHLACQSLRRRESDLALAGGVNLILSPEMTLALTKAHMMAPDGRCKTFDAAADGYVRGEGCGMVVLKRLSDALAAGDRILAVIRGSAVNHDGRSNGLSAPNGPAQEAVLRAALADAGLARRPTSATSKPTAPARAWATRSRSRPSAPCWATGARADRPLVVGSVKTNIGHLESAAGIAGLIKVMLMLAARPDSAAPAPEHRQPAAAAGRLAHRDSDRHARLAAAGRAAAGGRQLASASAAPMPT